MLSISRQTDYAARLVLHLSMQADATALVSIREIAEVKGMPLPFVRRLVGKLVRSGLLESGRGTGGGVRLARPASAIRLLDVVEAMEGGISLNRCSINREACPLGGNCPIRCIWAEANASLRQSLGGVDFGQLAAVPGHLEAHRSAKARAGKLRGRATSVL
jgi:Rrf2 family protein